MLIAGGTAVLLMLIVSVHAQQQDEDCPPSNPEILGRACSLANNRLAVDTNQFLSDCGYTAFCDPATNTCRPNQCRRDEYPFGYKRKCEWPALCEDGFFCPDESSGCLPVQPVGAPCQLNRDDECALSARGLDTVCLRNTCQVVNATAGRACISDNVIYNIYTSYSDSYGEIVSRDNCVTGYYCDGTQNVCLEAKNVGDECSANKECRSYNCVDSSVSVDIPVNNDPRGRCGRAPSIPNRPGVWVYIVITLAILLGAMGLCCALIQIHARGRRRTRQERKRYFERQALLRDDVYEAYYRASGKEVQSGEGTEGNLQNGRAYGSLSAMSQRSAANPATIQPLRHRDEKDMAHGTPLL
ncbi:hypothetical protein CF327_g1121 [Tilletia walkeri]|uniref:Uncharacterized protein n=1 Tax=Tilletia walkeri TaxID=117179 RepID=A0A8X7NG18_9BASI|nr:hypothetical protein CF327_g1121 [Tilletia walkeri]KAE8271715.1 hypothetical protein A4X09_0g635 [Tilletia walkeri]